MADQGQGKGSEEAYEGRVSDRACKGDPQITKKARKV